MATSRTAKVQAEIEKARLKIVEQQAKLKELEQKKTGIENTEILEIVRGMSIPLDELAALLRSVKSGLLPAASGLFVPKPTLADKEESE
ncbi:MAG: DUF4315 family protein [Clostridiales bacterium]|nr:DUF4315 family protein [Clostridiales bacterium]